MIPFATSDILRTIPEGIFFGRNHCKYQVPRYNSYKRYRYMQSIRQYSLGIGGQHFEGVDT